MKTFAFAVFCIAVSAVAASWHGGVAVVAPSAHGGAVAGHNGAAVIAGPSGTISTHGHAGWNGLGWAGHGLLNGVWNVAGHGAWNGGHGVWNGVHGGWAGSGHEGQWIPDGTEHLYDDGSYRAEHHHGW